MNEILRVDNDTMTVSARELHERLMRYDSFKDLFIAVSKEKVNRDWEGLSELMKVLDDKFVLKHGADAIVYLRDCISSERVLPMKSLEIRQEREKEIKKQLIDNFSLAFPDYKFIGSEVQVPSIGRIDILASRKGRTVIIEIKCGSMSPNIQLLAYASHYEHPILVGITEEPLNDVQKLDKIKYMTFEEIKSGTSKWVS